MCGLRTVVLVLGDGLDLGCELLGVVLGVVAQGPAGFEVPPRPGVVGDAVEHCVSGRRCGQCGVEHPDGVLVREPRAQLPAAGRPGAERADPGADGVDPVAVGVQPEQGLGRHLAHSVEGVRPAVDVDTDLRRAWCAADGVVAGGVDEAAYAVSDARLQQGAGRDHVGLQRCGQRGLVRDARQVDDRVRTRLRDHRVDGHRVGAVELDLGALPREGRRRSPSCPRAVSPGASTVPIEPAEPVRRTLSSCPRRCRLSSSSSLSSELSSSSAVVVRCRRRRCRRRSRPCRQSPSSSELSSELSSASPASASVFGSSGSANGAGSLSS